MTKQCPQCGDTWYRPTNSDDDVIECASCRTPLREAWLTGDDWTSERTQKLREVLGDVDVWTFSDGPNGPWTYRSLTVRRDRNRIDVKDVDGHWFADITVEELNAQADLRDEDIITVLEDVLDEYHEKSLDQL